MTKKDYILIANAIKEQWQLSKKHSEHPQHSGLAIHNTALRLAYAFKQDNPRFDVDRFLTACGVSND